MAALFRGILRDLKRAPEVTPLIVVVTAACSGAIWAMYHTVTTDKEVIIDHKNHAYRYTESRPDLLQLTEKRA